MLISRSLSTNRISTQSFFRPVFQRWRKATTIVETMSEHSHFRSDRPGDWRAPLKMG